ncbi:MAG TPA: DUF72 domain-containing protein [Flavipsychrobacter sp.]|nr:DUF72 domain-containing protein [Flavipsychrobacter sp.]
MAKAKKGKFYIGTSNLMLPVPKYKFPETYQDKSRLHYYASLFNSLEVNATFYKLPRAQTFTNWANDVSPGFGFTLKLSKEITHAKGMMYDPAAIERFMNTVDGLGNKKACLLIQFPASITVHHLASLEQILTQLDEIDPGGSWRKAVEFRHDSWYKPKVYSLLHIYNTAVVVHDIEKGKTPEIKHKENFVYLRFHGTEKGYRGTYHPEYLEDQANQIKKWLRQGKDVYAYFNNSLGNAFTDARLLQLLVTGKK